MNIKRRVCVMAFVPQIIAAGGCEQAQAFLPRAHTVSVSPDGRHTAWVRQGLNIDPPDDHLFLATRGGPTRALMDLAPDADWSKTIIWTPDSHRVGFVVSDDRLAVFDVATGHLDALFFLVGQGCCGGPQEARHVSFSNDGTEVSFDRFDRVRVSIRTRDGRQFDAAVMSESPEGLTSKWPLFKAERNLGREIVRVPVSRVRLRVAAAPARSLTGVIWVKVVSKDQRWIEVPVRPAADGLIVLPAVDDGPLDRLEIGFPSSGGTRAIVRDVKADGDEILLDVPPPTLAGRDGPG